MASAREIKDERKTIYFDIICDIISSVLALTALFVAAISRKKEKNFDSIEPRKDLKASIAKLARARLSASSVAQYAAVEILKNPGTHTKEMVSKLKERRDYSYNRLRKIEGITCVKPNGAFYLFPKLDFDEFGK